MSSYTITIAPDDHTRATTTLRVEVRDTAARITELLVRAGDGDGLTAGQLPEVDLDQLLRAVTPATTAAITATPPTAPAVAETPTEPAPTPAAPTAQPAAETVPPAAEPQPAPTEAAPTAGQAKESTTGARPRRSTTAAKKTPASGTKPSARASGSTKAAKATRVSKATKAAAAKKTPEAPVPGERVYRRAPEDLAEVYQQAGSAAALADHYGVPRHTAYGWIRTLRRDNTTTATS